MFIETNEETYMDLQHYMQEQMRKTNYFTIKFNNKTEIGHLLETVDARNKQIKIDINNNIKDNELKFIKNSEELFTTDLNNFKDSLIIN